ncbi:MAG TPA: adenylyltransferase/cytidyltransferase family protein [Ktedonobacterales bacterium]|nr:adenylyltransferase/cytidyltransferase family protein [Ktedonobacterales bacterium]
MGIVIGQAELAALVERRQGVGERVVFTNGVFDLLHLGHTQYLQRARALGDALIVGVNSDASTRALKGPRRPLVSEADRAATLAALAAVDFVTIFDDLTAEPLVAALRPAVYVKGADYATAGEQARDHLIAPATLRRIVGLVGGGDVPNAPAQGEPDLTDALAWAGLAERLPEARAVAAYGGALALLAYLPGHSTTALIERIVQRYAPDAADRDADK